MNYMTTPSDPASTTAASLSSWLTGRLPDDWFVAPIDVITDREEITVIGQLADVEVADATAEDQRRAARRGRAQAFREDTREARMTVAREIEHSDGRKVAWGVVVGSEQVRFTHLAVPVMTRLRQPERQVLDTLVASGVARSRADALAWCVRLVGEHTTEWLEQLRAALATVDEVRAQDPLG
jgi:hypothetical protein